MRERGAWKALRHRTCTISIATGVLPSRQIVRFALIRGLRPRLLSLRSVVPSRLLTHNFSPCTNVHINGQSSSLLEYSATARKRGYFKHTSGRTEMARPDARDSFHYPQANFYFLPDSFHYLRRKSLLQTL